MSKIIFNESPVSGFLFSDTRTALWWLLVRCYVGWIWLSAGWGKITSPAWTGESAGAALSGFVRGALEKTAGAHPDVTGWYASFLENIVLPNAEFWSYLIAYGELLVGVALVAGLFTGIAAFFGLFMNFNFMLAGALSSNPILFTLGLLLVLAWKVAGFWGLDRFLLPRLGTPWQPGQLFHR